MLTKNQTSGIVLTGGLLLVAIGIYGTSPKRHISTQLQGLGAIMAGSAFIVSSMIIKSALPSFSDQKEKQ